MKLNHIKLIAAVIALSCGSVIAAPVSQADNLGAQAMQAQQTAAKANNFAHMAVNTYNHTPAANRSVAAQAAQDAQSIADKAQADANAASHAAAVASAQQRAANAPVASQDPSVSRNMSIANTMGGIATAQASIQNPSAPAVSAPTATPATNTPNVATSTPVASQDPAVSKAMSAANVAGAAMVAGQPQNTMAVGVKNDPTGKPGTFTAQAVSTAPANSTINQAAASLNPSTPVSATINGQTVQTTAGAIAAVNPQAQIQTPINSVFAAAPRKGGNNHNDHNSHSEHGTGNGGNNAANSNSAHGLGGGNHIGGGSAQSGSRNVGHW
ncbi:hypothetical protein FMZ73_07430 [Salmonella enterica subsp. enterica]|nr:hypothetical protein [Salmonella enterica subsp. enterica serovar Nigeria]ECJ1028205.1 hypothetical protein [Salmonella enterica subsp. enterica serovar Nigeria]EGM6703114.1 hypothetical protein [Salmonella enterica subsp. enterica serovar Nigeria]